MRTFIKPCRVFSGAANWRNESISPEKMNGCGRPLRLINLWELGHDQTVIQLGALPESGN